MDTPPRRREDGERHFVVTLDSIDLLLTLLSEAGGCVLPRPPTTPVGPPPMEISDAARWLSPTEELLVRAASAAEWRTAAQLCEAAGLLKDGDVPSTMRVLLANLAERHVLESHPRQGYRLVARR